MTEEQVRELNIDEWGKMQLQVAAEEHDPAGYSIGGRDMKAREIFYDAVKTLWVEFGFNYLNLSESRLSVLAESEDDKCLDDHWEVHAIWTCDGVF